MTSIALQKQQSFGGFQTPPPPKSKTVCELLTNQEHGGFDKKEGDLHI